MAVKTNKLSPAKDQSAKDFDTSAHQIVDVPQKNNDNQPNNPNRRKFLGQAGAASLFAAGLLSASEILGKGTMTVLAQTCPTGCELVPLTGAARADESRRRRYAAAESGL